MGQNPSHFASTGEGKDAVAGMDTRSHPVDRASWYDAADFCAKLSQQEQRQPFYLRTDETLTTAEGTGYRLPTEAQWEFACRAGTTTRYWGGDKHSDVIQVDWIGANSGGRTHRGGALKANPFGLFDVHGNLVEWVHGGWRLNSYEQFVEEPALNPIGPFHSHAGRVLRGGTWWSNAYTCRASRRISHDLTNRYNTIGFRLVLPVDVVK
jgi:formylglycine-generating enzyme required for sulfatase activity